MNPILFRILYYFLSFTWGILSTLAGSVIALVMLITGHRPRRFCGSIYFECGKNFFGGFSYGIFFFKDRNPNVRLMCHEYGHSLQNCVFGPFMLLIVNLPSTVRYWHRRISVARHRALKTEYDDIWFEGQATRIGTLAYEKYYRKDQ
mgnify:CR=1 FL=1